MPPGSGSAELFADPGSGRTFQDPEGHFRVRMRMNILGSRIRIKSVGIRNTAESRTFVTLLIFEAKTASPVRTGGAGTAVDLGQLSILPAPTI